MCNRCDYRGIQLYGSNHLLPPRRERARVTRKRARLAAKSLGLSQQIMRADTQEEEGFPFDTEREPVILGDPAFPEVLIPLHFLDLKRGMPGNGQKEGKLFPGSILHVGGQSCKFLIESFRSGKDHRPRLLTSSSTLEKVLTLPARTSRSAARSPLC